MKRICTRLFTLLALAMTLMGTLLFPGETSDDMGGGYGVSISGNPSAVDSITLYGQTVSLSTEGM